MAAVFDVLEKNDRNNVRLVVGNTSVGIYKNTGESVLVDISAVAELQTRSVGPEGVTVGAAVSIDSFIALVKEARTAEKNEARVNNLTALLHHANKVANVHVRHAGSVAGNLAMAKSLGFLSDLATILLGADATVTLASRAGSRTVSMEEFLASATFAKGELIQSISVGLTSPDVRFSTYKAALRPQNSHAYINAALQVTLGDNVIQKPVLAFGGVLPEDTAGSHAVRAKQTEEFLAGKAVNEETLSGAVRLLKEELNPESPYRKRLVVGFFYKFFVSLLSEAPSKLVSAQEDTTLRGVTRSSQKFTLPDVSNGPASKPKEKVSAKLQAAGEAAYIDDLPMHKSGFFACLVTASVARGKIANIDASKALSAPGVGGFLSAADVPGDNNYNVTGGEKEPIFAEEAIDYYGQPVGMILADSERHAREAALLVDVTYDAPEKAPVATIEQALAQRDTFVTPVRTEHKNGDVDEELEKAECRTQGAVKVGTQKHFYMETQGAYAMPDENGRIVVHSANQWPDGIQGAVARSLGLPLAKTKIVFRRAGGAFGGKLTAAALCACATAVAARVTGVPVRLVLDRNTDMMLVGGREETEVTFDVAFNKDGKITALKVDGHVNSGAAVGLSGFTNVSFPSALNQVYDVPAFLYGSTVVRSNTPSRTVVRGPGEISASFVMESIIDAVAAKLEDKTPEQVREANFYVINGDEKKVTPNGSALTHYSIPEIWKLIKEKARYEERLAAVQEFNKCNRWKKRGISITPVRYEVSVWPKSALVNIYGDGSVIVTHSACEMGQGLDTKVAQLVAMELGKVFGNNDGIDMDLVTIGDTDTTITPNAMFTGGSTGSEGTAEAARRCCATLVERLKPVLGHLQAMGEGKEEGKEAAPITWAQLCAAAKGASVNLSVVDHWSGAGDSALTYMNYGAGLSEVVVDVITGETKIVQSDLVYDCGISLNPAIDIGQAEGAFMMGVGHVLREEELLADDLSMVSNGTWEYKPPCVKDLPEVLNIELLNNPNFDKGILSSKCSGEPPLVLACSVACAVRQAVASARADSGVDAVFELPMPMTPRHIQEACATPDSHLAKL